MHVCVYIYIHTYICMCVCLRVHKLKLKRKTCFVYFSIDRIYYNRHRFLLKKLIHIIKKIEENTYSSFPTILNKQIL